MEWCSGKEAASESLFQKVYERTEGPAVQTQITASSVANVGREDWTTSTRTRDKAKEEEISSILIIPAL